MVRRPKLIATILALVLIFLIAVTPLLVAPSVAAYSIKEYSEDSIEASSWFDQNQGQLFSNEIMLNLLPANFSFSPSGIFSFKQDNQKNVEFGVYYSQLVEFNDTNGNNMLDVGEIIRNVSLDDFTWTYQQLNTISGEVILPLIGIKPPISIVFMLHLYLTTKNVSLSDEYSYLNFTVPGGLTVKTFVMINGYDWTQDNGSLPINNSRMLALEMTLRSEVNPGNQRHMFQLANGTKINDTQTMNDTRPVLSTGTNQSMISLVTQGNVTHGELRWFNKAIADGGLINLNASYMTNGTAFNLYLSVPYYGNNTLFLDPAFFMQNAPSASGGEQVSLALLLFILPYYSSSTGLLYLSFLVVSVAALIIGIVYYLRRKRL